MLRRAPSFRVLTLNAWMTPLVARDAARRCEIIPDAIVSTGADVVAFQEVWTSGARERLVSELARRGYSHHRFAEGSRGWVRGRMGNGLLIVSRHPIHGDHDLLEFSAYTYNEEYFVRKGAIHLQIDVPALGRVDFYDSHLGAMRFDAKTGGFVETDLAAHARQSWELAKFVKATASRGRSRVLAMDFNSGLDSENFQFVCDTLQMRDSFHALRPEGAERVFTFDRRNPYVAEGGFAEEPSAFVDYILAGGEAGLLSPRRSRIVFDQPHSATGLMVSDHYGVLTEFEIGV